MNKKIIVSVVIICICGTIFLVYTFIGKPKWSPNYCSQFSGTHSYAWGGSKIQECEENGCRVKIIEEMGNNDNIYDNEAAEIECIKK
jgi:hypothetical protein